MSLHAEDVQKNQLILVALKIKIISGFVFEKVTKSLQANLIAVGGKTFCERDASHTGNKIDLITHIGCVIYVLLFYKHRMCNDCLLIRICAINRKLTKDIGGF